MDIMGEELSVIREMMTKDYPALSEQDIRKSSLKIMKFRWKKKDGEWHARSGLAAEMPIRDFYKLQKIRPEVPDTPDFTQQEDYAVAAFKKYPYQFSLIGNVEVVEEVSSPSLFSIISGKSDDTIKNDRPNDYVLMKSTLCTSLPFVNANGDAFEAGDMIEAVESGQLDKFQPAIVDWRHDFQAYGNTIGAEIVEKNLEIEGFGKNKVKQIIVYSVFYAWLHQYKAKKIRDWAKKGVLTFSMACGAEDTEYLNGGAVRVLQKPHFVANSIIPPDLDPADENATLVEMAGKDNKIPVVYASYNEYPDAVRENLTLAWVEDKNDENNIGVDMDKIKELESTVAQLQAKIDAYEQSEDAKQVKEIEDKLTKAEADLESVNEDLSGVQGERDSLEDELAAVKEELKTVKEEVVTIKEAMKKMREKEVEDINNSRKAKLAEIFGDDTDKIDHWFAKCEAKFDDDGNIVDREEDFQAMLSNFPEIELSDEEKEKRAAEAKAKEELEDVDESDKVNRSKKIEGLATKVVDDNKGERAFSKTM